MKLAPIALTAGLLAAVGTVAYFAPTFAVAEDQTDASASNIEDDDPVIAKVGDADLRLSELTAQAQLVGGNLQMLPEAQRQTMLLDMAISTHLGAIAAKRDGVDNSEEYKRAMGVIERQMLYSLWMQELSDEVASDAKIDEALKDDKYGLEVPQEVNARHILVETEDEAKDLIKQLDDGADFAALAAEHSTGPSGRDGGALGWFRHAQMVTPFADAAFDMEVGTFSKKPVQTQFGWHVIEVLERRENVEEVREEIANRLLGDAIEARLGALRDEVGVTFVDADDNSAD